MKFRVFSIICWLAVICFGATTATPSIEQHLQNDSKVRFILHQENTEGSARRRLGPFDASLLKESILESYSVWRVDGGPVSDLQMEVFEFVDSLGAYALFSFWPQIAGRPRGETLAIPYQNDFSPRQCVLWAGRYFVRFLSPSTAELPRRRFERFASGFLSVKELDLSLPLAVRQLPGDGLVADSVRFYLGPSSLSLNPRFPMPLLDAIGFQDRVQVAHARYRPSDSSLFILVYPTPALARDYVPRIQSILSRYISEQGIFLKRSGIVVSLFAGPEKQAQEILSAIEYKPTIQWIENNRNRHPLPTSPAEYRSFFGFLLSTFRGIGVGLMLVCLSGVLIGLIRYELLSRVPFISHRNEMIRLHLLE